ncbi:iron ABC transporter permease [Aliiglaciecola litoralis]|uniref:Iron ABC transporter permease n=2 Tax=Aliiglaciecola litoralis TaxID=582857 RepID=A0ABP3WP73_9ALTE
MLVSSLLALPVIVVFASWSTPQLQIWQHLAQTVLSDYVFNSLILAFSVGIGCLIIGTTLAWCVVKYEFWGRRLLQWLFILPLAMPAYIIAYTYTGLLDFAGPVQTALRDYFQLSYGQYWFPEIRSLGGAVSVMVLVLYPYVYILARTAFTEQSRNLKEASGSLGVSSFNYFRKVAWPLARPALLTGSALAMMEAFADYGTVQYFGVSTFTTGIFRTWFGLDNQLAASQLAALLCTFVLVVLLLEKWSRRQIRYYQSGQSHQPIMRKKLSLSRSVLMFLLCLTVPFFGFILPVGQLLIWALSYTEMGLDSAFFTLMWNSFWLAAVTACLVVLIALLYGFAKRLSPTPMMTWQVQGVSLGYAIPGTVIAVGVLVPLSWADHQFNQITALLFNLTPGLIFSGTVFALILAYTVRFLAVALQSVEAGLGRVTPAMDEAARCLGASPRQVLWRVHLPIMRASILSAALLVFVDVLKELPATLILRPFNFDTLAVSAFQYASDERLIDAALPALAIVLAGLLPVILLSRAMDKHA